jgi:hypothetical protein
MKYSLLFAFIVLTSFQPVETKVYLCGSTGAKKYHYKENCRGLNACKHEIVKTSLSKAQTYGLTLCGWED